MPNDKLIKPQISALALPAFVDPTDRRGTEGITAEDIRLPRLSLAQALSPEVLKGDAKRIDGLEAGDLFSNLFQTNYKNGPVEVVIVRREQPRAMEFWPKGSKEGQGIKDRSVPLSDPRTKFQKDGTPPVATVFHEYIAFDAKTREPFVVSLKGTSSGAARALNTFLSLRKGPAFASTFKISSAQKSFDGGTCYVFTIQPGGPVDAETFAYAGGLYDDFKGREVEVPTEGAEVVADPKVPF